VRIERKKGTDKVLAWWISASSSLRDSLKDLPMEEEPLFMYMSSITRDEYQTKTLCFQSQFTTTTFIHSLSLSLSLSFSPSPSLVYSTVVLDSPSILLFFQSFNSTQKLFGWHVALCYLFNFHQD
jgi:hypothetical protein